MDGFLETFLSAICHRGGRYADVLPLCLRCSCVYSGALVGIVFEWVLLMLRKTRPGPWAFCVAAGGLALMALVGLGGLHGVWEVPLWLKLFSAFLFGQSVALFAVTAIAGEFGLTALLKPERCAPRLGMIALAALCVVAVLRWPPAIPALAAATLAGLPAVFVTVNLAFALVLLRRVDRTAWRLAASAPAALFAILAEFALFALWRRLL